MHNTSGSRGARVGYILSLTLCTFFFTALSLPAQEVINLDGSKAEKRFDGVGAVSGGGATSVLLKDYPQQQRNQILDLLFKPDFGAAMSTLYVEVPGDGNSTQGSESSHMHSRTDENYFRGYEWWIMREAKLRNPDLTLDCAAWGCPGWIGNGKFGSQDMCDYYVKWILGLKRFHGMSLDSIGCRNEKGVDENFVKMLRKSLNAAGLNSVRTHGFDNWGKTKWDWTRDLTTDSVLRDSVDIISNHTMSEVPATDQVKALAIKLNKPIWNTEEHVYKKGYDDELLLVHTLNENFISSDATKVVSWYLEDSTYPNEPYSLDPAPLIADSPWSGEYSIKPKLWGYAHYGQFVKLGWQYIREGCRHLPEGGSIITMKASGSKAADFSVIAETRDAKGPQTLAFDVGPGLRQTKLCVWMSDAQQQFIRKDDLTPVNGKFSVTLAPNTICSLSTTTGQQKGSFPDVPKAATFPLPYADDFKHYGDPKTWGYLPHYTADICGAFELVQRPDNKGICLKQMLTQPAQSWAPEWMPYTIIGDSKWTDYEVRADVLIDNDQWAGIMGRISATGGGYGCNPKGYYLRFYNDGRCELYASNSKKNGAPGKLLASGNAPGAPEQWHNLKLQFKGTTIKGFIDDNEVVSVEDDQFKSGNAGLVTGGENNARNTAYFDNLAITAVGTDSPPSAGFPADRLPIYKP